jgi:hypothetical protein
MAIVLPAMPYMFGISSASMALIMLTGRRLDLRKPRMVTLSPLAIIVAILTLRNTSAADSRVKAAKKRKGPLSTG